MAQRPALFCRRPRDRLLQVLDARRASAVIDELVGPIPVIGCNGGDTVGRPCSPGCGCSRDGGGGGGCGCHRRPRPHRQGVPAFMFAIAASAAALILTIRFAAVTADVGVVLHVRWSTSLRRLLVWRSIRWSMPAVRFAAVTADVGVGHRVCWSTRRWGRRLPLVADVTWQIHSVQELRVLFFAMHGPLSVFGMVFVNVSHECSGRGMWIGWVWRRLSFG